jgi:hypothetical protein
VDPCGVCDQADEVQKVSVKAHSHRREARSANAQIGRDSSGGVKINRTRSPLELRRHRKNKAFSKLFCIGLCAAQILLEPSGLATPKARAASSESEHPPSEEPVVAPLEVGVEAYTVITFAKVCRAEVDGVACDRGTNAVGLAIVPRWRLASWVSAGVLAAFGTKPKSEQRVSSTGVIRNDSQRFWRLALEGRIHPFGWLRPDLWLAAEGGIASLTDSSEILGASPESATYYAPSIGAGLGIDFYVFDRVALGLESRALLLFFGKRALSTESYAPDKRSYGTQPGLWLALTATIRPAL